MSYSSFTCLPDDAIDKVIDELNKPRSVCVGPLEEIDYWRYRCKTLTSVNEALRAKDVQEIIELWNACNPDAPPFNRALEIKSLMAEAKDNARWVKSDYCA